MDLVHFFDDPLFSNPLHEFDRLFDQAFSRHPGTAPHNQLQTGSAPHALPPSTDVRGDTERNVVSVPLPGISKQNVSLDLRNNVLTVSGEPKSEHERKDSWFFFRERNFGRFARSIPVPEGVKPEEIHTAMENGVLTITYPRPKPEQQSKKTSIS